MVDVARGNGHEIDADSVEPRTRRSGVPARRQHGRGRSGTCGKESSLKSFSSAQRAAQKYRANVVPPFLRIAGRGREADDLAELLARTRSQNGVSADAEALLILSDEKDDLA